MGCVCEEIERQNGTGCKREYTTGEPRKLRYKQRRITRHRQEMNIIKAESLRTELRKNRNKADLVKVTKEHKIIIRNQ